MATPFESLYEREKRDLGIDDPADDAEADVLAQGDTLAARSTTIDGERVDVEDPLTPITFEDNHGSFGGDKGRPRPRDFWHARRLGQTPPMELLKNTIAHQLTGGHPMTESDDELRGSVQDLADITVDIYEGPHFQEKSWDNLIVDAVNDLVDTAWAYWELLDAQDSDLDIPVAFKPLPPLQVQHNVDDDTGQLEEDPAFYHVPIKRQGGSISTGGEATPLDRDRVVAMREPHSSRSNKLYGESIATRVREWLELIIDVDTHQKRYYADSELPAGFLHFEDNINDDDLNDIQQDIREAAGDPHELVTTSSSGGAKWVPVGDSVVDLEAIEEQKWYFKLVFAAAGLNLNELGIVEGSGFAKETPALQKAIYKKVTKPFMGAILKPQNTQVVPQIAEGVGVSEVPFDLSMERFDPVQEQIERDERLSEYEAGARSLNELRSAYGLETDEYPVEIGGETVDVANVPKDVVDTLIRVNGDGEDGEGDSGNSNSGASVDQDTLGEDPRLSVAEAGEKLGLDDAHKTARRLQVNTKELDDTIEVESSFLVSVAYERQANILQLEFERTGPNWKYWYGAVPEYRFFNFLQAASKGGYFNKYIRGEYQYARL